MESEPYGSTVLRSVTRRGSETVVALQGVVQFTGAEPVLHHLQQLTGAPTTS